MPASLIGLGSNLGNRQQMLDRAVARLAREPNIRPVAQSRPFDTAPVGGPPGQGRFLNGALLLETALEPEALLAVLQRIERELGRRQTGRWGPRPLDLDLLLYDRLVLETPALVVPHPRMAWRRFVLEPAAEVAGGMVHPTTGWTVARLLGHLNTAVPYVAIAGPIAAGKTLLAGSLARQTPARLIAEQVTPQRLEWFYADPSGHGWDMELEFLQQRARLLAADLPDWSEPGGPAVSDFWFDQSLAFAGVWLPPGRLDAFRRAWEELRRGVVRPKLTVLLDAPTDRLLERIRRRGCPAERRLSAELLDRIRDAILTLASRPDQGPLLRLTNDDPDRSLDEVTAAVEAMG